MWCSLLQVIDILTVEIMPVLRESGMAGRVEYVCDMRLFNGACVRLWLYLTETS